MMAAGWNSVVRIAPDLDDRTFNLWLGCAKLAHRRKPRRRRKHDQSLAWRRSWLYTANAQTILELLQPRLVLISEGLNLLTERLNLSLGRQHLRRELVVQDMKLVGEDLDSLLDVGEGALSSC